MTTLAFGPVKKYKRQRHAGATIGAHVLKNRFNRWTVFTIAAFAFCFDAAIVSAAPTQAQQDAIRSSCQSDYRTYCSSVPTGGSAALQCLEKNVASLSSSCQQAVRAASGGDATTAAPAPAPAATAPAAPTEPAAAAAPAPVALQPKQEMALMRQACGGDYRNYCAGVRIIGGGAVSCLVSHAASLSQGCKSALGSLGQRF
jgi:hypothetical protein